ncbi:MAG: O-antigen ligase family protein [Bacteroidota bacterium]
MTNKLQGHTTGKGETVLLTAILVVVFTVPFSGTFNSLAIMLLGLVWLLQRHYKNLRQLFTFNFGVSFLFYLMFIVGLTYTQDLKNGMFQIEQKLSLIVFPFLFATIPALSRRNLKLIFSFFVLVCLLASVYSVWAGAFVNYRHNQLTTIDLANFTNQNLAGYIGTHSTYFSMYIAFSIFIVFESLKNNSSKRQRLVYFTLIAWFVFFLFLLAARIVLIAFILIALVYLVKATLQTRKNYKLLLPVIGGGLILTLALSGTAYFKNRFSEIYSVNMSNLIGSNSENGVTQRFFFWKNSLDIIQRSPFIGHGTGDAHIEFKKQYADLLLQNPGYQPSVVEAIRFFEKQQYNSHNQFLQVLILFGATGLVVFLILFARCYYVCFKRKNILYFSFITIVFFSCLTECVFDRQFGVVFFSVFNAIFLFHDKENENASANHGEFRAETPDL